MKFTGEYTEDPKTYNYRPPELNGCRSSCACPECGAIYTDSICCCLGVGKCTECDYERPPFPLIKEFKIDGLVVSDIVINTEPPKKPISEPNFTRVLPWKGKIPEMAIWWNCSLVDKIEIWKL